VVIVVAAAFLIRKRQAAKGKAVKEKAKGK
jgi:hypothetical protein